MRTRDAVKYGRVSSKEQEKEGFSIPAQWKLLDQYATAEGFRVVREFVDVETAKTSVVTSKPAIRGHFKTGQRSSRRGR
jgi:DNA invertase Pin-like site-specific DNA recombinase